MLQDLLDRQQWDRFLLRRAENKFCDPREQKELTAFVESGEYLTLCRQIVDGAYTFSIPRKKKITRNASGKKRVVYCYTPQEMLVLKYLSHLLYRYDSLFSPCLYSFRRGTSVKAAVRNLFKIVNLRRMYGVKIDISNYFNSIDPDLLLPVLRNDIDQDVYSLLSQLLMRQQVMDGEQIVAEQTGAMAGVPISPFLANYYLKDMDAYFFDQPIVYMRYADDIILFANTEEQRDAYYQTMLNLLNEKHLLVNPSKVSVIAPGDDFEFLGYLFGQNKIDVSHRAVQKMKAKISRKAHALRRWAHRKGIGPEKALSAMNKRFNMKFYGHGRQEMSWMYWYFPFITTSESLSVIDHYMQQMQRWLFTGRHSKINFKACTYEQMKAAGYRPLVAEYYAFREANEDAEDVNLLN